MANVRIIYNNIADTATITSYVNPIATFGIANVQNIKKTSVHRSLTTGLVTYTLTWSADQKVSAIALPATNLVNGATIKVELFSTTTATTPIADSGTVTAAKDRSVTVSGGYSASSFPYIGATKTSVWFNTEYTVRKVVITVNNGTNGYVDCARIVCGTYWESGRQVSNGITLGLTDSSILTTSRSGDIYVDRRPVSETMQFQLQYLYDTDRRNLLQIMRTCASNGLMYISIFPDNTNPEVTQTYSIYGRAQDNNIEYAMFNLYNRSININSW
jgi:hypothetical protein